MPSRYAFCGLFKTISGVTDWPFFGYRVTLPIEFRPRVVFSSVLLINIFSLSATWLTYWAPMSQFLNILLSNILLLNFPLVKETKVLFRFVLKHCKIRSKNFCCGNISSLNNLPLISAVNYAKLAMQCSMSARL